MANLFTITPSIRQLASNAIDTMIDQLGKDCLLVFDSQKKVHCPNCLYDVARQASSGVYNGTGPKPFTHPPCPVCHGVGTVESERTTRVLRLLIDWQPKVWNYVADATVKVPQGLVRTKGYVADMDSILQCQYIVLDHNHVDFENNRFQLWGEPVPAGNIVQNRFMTALWNRTI